MVGFDFGISFKLTLGILFLLFCLLLSIQSVSQNNLAYRIEKLPTNINSVYEEIKPMCSANGDSLFFIRTGFPENKGGIHAEEDIWFSSWSVDKNWQNPTNKLDGINDAGANIFAGIAVKSEIIYLFNYATVSNKRFIGISSHSMNSGSIVKDIIDRDHSIEIDNDFHDLYLHPNEEVLLISMSAINTLGLEDIYISTRESNDTWGRPINLGSAINSRGFEISPFLSEDGTALYFASNGHGGLGDADIYCSYRQDESWTSWSKPENMGPPFNSTKFDAYLSKNKKGDFFISSNRGGKYSDIYKISLSEINSVIQNDPAKDTEPSHAQEFASNDSISFPEKWVAFFEFDKFELSQMEHQKLNKFISENLRNSIEYQMCISGYTDDTGTENYNRKLSLKRAKSIYKILRKAGIEKRLIEVEGKGIYPASEKQLSTPVLMRRVEIALKAIE